MISKSSKKDVTTVDTFVNQYSICVKKTTSSILELADCIYRAKMQLSKDVYSEFCKQIDVAESSSYLKKLHCIAQKSARFKLIESQLPANYTTLYSLTKVTDVNFQKMCDKNVINPLMTAKQLNAYLDQTPKQKAVVFEVFFKISNTLTSAEIVQIVESVESVTKTFNINLEKSDDLQSFIDNEKVVSVFSVEASNESKCFDEVAA